MRALSFTENTSPGSARRRTWEGYLLCQAVPVARTGAMLYGAHELPILEPDADGRISVSRDPAELFNPESMASAEGKPVTNDHPPDAADVDPANFNEWAVGVCLNPRKGTGDLAGHLVMDLQIMQAKAIRDVEAGKVEVSGGYSPDYVQTGPGRAVQRAIRWNHVALVQAGRCGPSCAIRDHAITTKDTSMNSSFRPLDRVPAGAATVRAGTWPPGRYAYEITPTGIVLRAAEPDGFRLTTIAPLSELARFPNGQVVASWAPGDYAYEAGDNGLTVFRVWPGQTRDRRADRIDRAIDTKPYAVPSLEAIQAKNEAFWRGRS